MKRLILILLLSYSLCNIQDIYYLEKYGEVKTTSKKGIVYLNIEEFKEKDTIYILFTSVNGDMKTKIEYGFNDLAPEDLTMVLDHSMTPSLKAESDTDTVTEYILKYYYDIEKEENKKFLIIRYSDFYGSYLEIEHTRVNWGRVAVIIIIGSIGLAILIIIIIFLITRCKKKSNLNSLEYTATPSDNIYYEPKY